MELRDMEIFLTLAQELHFGRTAKRLRVSPSRVSQAIRKQERMIGAPLFERTSRTVRLTAVDAVLSEELRPAYDSLHAAVAAAKAAARQADRRLTIGAMGAQAHELSAALDRFKARHPEVALAFREVHFSEPFDALRSGEVDLLITWLPVAEPDLTVGPTLREEPLRLMVAAGDPLAGADAVRLEALGDLVVPLIKGSAPRYWLESVIPSRTPSGRAVRHGAEVATFQEVLALVANGEAACPVPDEARRYYARPGVVYLPIADAEPVRWGLTWCTARTTPLVEAFAAEAARPQPH